MLGVFLPGLLSRQQTNCCNIIAVLIGTTVYLVLLLLMKWEKIDLGWSRLIVIGNGATFIIFVTGGGIVAFIK
jgi:hypothetical protein